jgi:NAD(P)-dependent dehydrogenase (short-subunit alcohol dehydrogenase family)
VTTQLSGVALVTGASSGIGQRVAGALAAAGMKVCLTGRDAGRLESCASEITALGRPVLLHRADLASDEEIRRLAEWVGSVPGRLDVLVHAAGTIHLGNIEVAGWSDFDEQYAINLRAPFLLTKALLPLLKQSRGQIVFVNSTAGLAGGVDNALYAATKHGLRSLAGSIRDHVNPHGIRVMSVFPGRTATPMQEAVYRFEGRRYQPEGLMQPADVAETLLAALALPRSAEVTDVMVRPMSKPSR